MAARKRSGRDYAAEYRARQARARAQGYTGYYAKRIRGGAPPSAPAPRGQALREARGHASAADLERLLESKQVASITFAPTGRDLRSGRWNEATVSVILPDGSARHFRLRGAKLAERELRPLRSAIVSSGVDVYSDYPELARVIMGEEDVLDEAVA